MVKESKSIPLIFYKVRWLSVSAVICLVINSIVMLMAGIYKSYHAVEALVTRQVDSEFLWSDIALKYVIQSIDAFLLAMILAIFAFGIFSLFINRISGEFKELVGIASIKTIGQLKKLLAEVIIIILFVHFLRLVIIDTPNGLNWHHLILPIAILLLSGGLKLLELDDRKQSK